MESVIFKAGELATHALCELSSTKSINPIFLELENGKTTTKEFSQGLLTSTIPQAISRLEESDGDEASIILPVEIKENNKLSKAILVVVQNYKKDYELTLSIRYSFNGDELEIEEYQLVEYDNLFEKELKELENEFVSGLLTPKIACDIWLKGA